MVSFSCESCGDVLTKKKLDQHQSRCYGATFTCIDCMVYFPGTSYRSHTSCISEDQKYQGALYKEKKARFASNPTAGPAEPKKMSLKPYVEEVPEDAPEDYGDYEDNSDDDAKSPAEPLPEAPTPPPATEVVNVFDFLDVSTTPDASTVNFPHHVGGVSHNEDTQLVRYGHEVKDVIGDELVQYGTGPIPLAYQTPGTKAARKKTKEGLEVKTDKKRKRLHVETDQVMTDAPPVLHSGLTGGLNRLMKPVFPPSPDYSGGDAGPTSPIKKSRHSKHSKSTRNESNGIGNNLLAMVTSGARASKTKKKKKTTKKHKSRHHDDKSPKLIEYTPSKKEGAGSNNEMVLYKPRADLFLSFVNKGPESGRGCSVNKALKRYHRERASSGESLSKVTEEKELWKSLRLRKNERGEIVVFGL